MRAKERIVKSPSRMTPEEFLHQCRELKVPQFLASCSREVHVVAPEVILRAVRRINSDYEFSHSADSDDIRGSPVNIVVFDTAKEKPSAIVRAKYPNAHVHVMNGELALRLACGVRTFEGKKTTPEIRYCIVCLPRSGSTLLVTLLNQLGVGRPLEHIRMPVVSLIRSGCCTFESALQHISVLATRNGIFGTKFISEFMLKIFDHDGAAKFAEYLDREGYKIVYLKRNHYEQAVSWYFANRTGQWHLRGDAQLRESNIPYDFAELALLYERFQKEEKFLEDAVKAVEPEQVVTLDYTELDNDPEGMAIRVGKFVHAHASLRRGALRRSTRKISDHVIHLREFRRQFEIEYNDDNRAGMKKSVSEKTFTKVGQ